MITTKNICKSYKNHKVLDNISLVIEKGEIIGLAGPNGAGKTSLLHILALISAPDRGKYLIEETDTKQNIDYYRSFIGYVPQEIALFDELSVKDNLICWSKYGFSQAKKQMLHISNELNLLEVLNKKVKNLSGGMKRRVNIAVALLNEPKILIMDEPMVGIDEKHCKLIFSYLKKLSNKGVTQIISSHSTEQLIATAHKIIYLNEGNICFYDDANKYFDFLDKNLKVRTTL